MGNKICCTCKIKKPIDLFNKNKSRKDGYNPSCRECSLLSSKKWVNDNREKNNEHKKKYRDKDENKEIAKVYKKEYSENNKQIIKEKSKFYYENNKEKYLEYTKEYRKNNLDKVKNNINKWKKENKEKDYKRYDNYRKNRLLNDPLFKLINDIRSTIRSSFKSKNLIKKCKSELILGCSFEEFKICLELKFEDWMTWENKGNPKDGILEPNKTWDIDHIIPTSTAITEEDVIRLNHYTNLQPLCSFYNRNIKKDKIII
jgi:hypothetical protein